MSDHPVTIQGPIAAGDTITVTVAQAAPPPPPPPPPPIVIPFQGFAKTEAVLDPGTTVRVPAGVYKERPILAKAGTKWIGDPGARLDFTGLGVPLQAGGLTINGPDIVFQGIELYGSSGAGVQVNGPRVQLVEVKSTKHLQEAYAWRKTADHGLMKGGEIAFVNEFAKVYLGGEQGVGKTISVGLKLSGVAIHDIGMDPSHPTDPNVAPGGEGAWWDSVGLFSSDGVMEECNLWNIWAPAFFYEISLNGKLTRNVFHNTGKTPWGSGQWGAAALSSASSGVEVTDNVFFDVQQAFRLVAWDRDPAYDGPKNADGTPRVGDHNVFADNVVIDASRFLFAFAAGAHNHTAIRNFITSAASGNQAMRNRFSGKVAVQWGDTTLTTLAQINALPGGGGSTMLTQAERDRIVAAIPNGVAATLAAAGIA